jgi:hypothetical protein
MRRSGVGYRTVARHLHEYRSVQSPEDEIPEVLIEVTEGVRQVDSENKQRN